TPPPLAKAWTYCFYTDDKDCKINREGGYNTPLRHIGADLAWDIYNRFSRFNIPVDVIGHSMGGLILRAALAGVAHGDDGFPPYLLVEDAVTVSTPHHGTYLAAMLVALGIELPWTGGPVQQAVDMEPNSDFLNWAEEAPQGYSGTFWTYIG